MIERNLSYPCLVHVCTCMHPVCEHTMWYCPYDIVRVIYMYTWIRELEHGVAFKYCDEHKHCGSLGLYPKCSSSRKILFEVYSTRNVYYTILVKFSLEKMFWNVARNVFYISNWCNAPTGPRIRGSLQPRDPRASANLESVDPQASRSAGPRKLQDLRADSCRPRCVVNIYKFFVAILQICAV